MATVDEQVTALNNLIAGVNLAQSRGTYSLSEAAAIHGAVTLLVDSVNNQSTDQQQPADVEVQQGRQRKRSSKKTS